MSASTLLFSNKQLFVDTLKQKCMKILQQNQRGLHQVVASSISNHIQYVYLHKTEYISVSNEIWLREQIQNVLKWFGDPRSRWKWENIKQKQYRWQKEKKQWQKTIEKALGRQNEIINKYENEILEWKRLYRQGKEKCRQVEAKNSVLESVNKIYQKNLQNNKNVVPLNNCTFMNAQKSFSPSPSLELEWQVNKEQFSESRNYKLVTNLQQSKSTMTVEMINLEEKQRDIGQVRKGKMEIKNQEVMRIVIQGSQKLGQGIEKANKIEDIISKNSRQFSKFTQTTQNEEKEQKKPFSLKIEEQIFSVQIQIEQINHGNQDKNNIEFSQLSQHNYKQQCPKCKRLIQQEVRSDELNVSSSQSSQQSYIVQFDRQIQTTVIQRKQIQIQTEELKQQRRQTKAQQSMIEESIVTPLLKKLSHLEKQIDKLTQISWTKSEKISEFEQMLKDRQLKITDYLRQNKQIEEINNLLKSKYQESTQKLQQISEKYRELLAMFSGYIEQFGNTPYTQQIISESEQSEKKTQASIKSASSVNYKQSQQIQHFVRQPEQDFHQEQATIEKATIARYFFDFLKLELSTGKNQKKLTLLTTIMSVLGIKQDKENVISRYVDKMGWRSNKLSDIIGEVSQEQATNNRKKSEKEGNQWLRQRLYQYLTDQF